MPRRSFGLVIVLALGGCAPPIIGGVPGGGDGSLQPPHASPPLHPPPPCVPEGGSEDAGCLAPCEYHRGGGPLTAVAKWTWGPVAQAKPGFTDVWATPAVGRIHDGNCDGRVDELDPPDVVFVSGRAIDATTG